MFVAVPSLVALDAEVSSVAAIVTFVAVVDVVSVVATPKISENSEAIRIFYHLDLVSKLSFEVP